MDFKRIFEINDQCLEIKGYYSRIFDANYSMESVHAHKYYEIMYAVNGSFTVGILDEDMGITYPIMVESKQFIFLDAGCFHKLIGDGKKNVQILNIEFLPTTKELFNPFKINDCLSFSVPLLMQSVGWKRYIASGNKYFVQNDNLEIEELLKSILNELEGMECDFVSMLAKQLKLYELLIKIGRSIQISQTENIGIVHINKALSFIKHNFTRPIKVADVADCAGITSAYLQRLFKANVGKNILETINHFRVEKAKRQLAYTKRTVDEIAQIVGYSGRRQFIYEFKQITGITPTTYRTHNAEKEFTKRQESHETVRI